MISLARLWLTTSVLLAALTGPALAQDGRAQPFELVRSLRTLQDRIAYGDAEAYAAQKPLIARIANELTAADPSVWDDPRNARAAVIYALSGGEPRALKPLFRVRKLSGIDDKLLNGALAYCGGHNADAAELLGGVAPRSLEPTLGAQVALVRATLASAKEPAKAITLLDDARLLAPGTLIEEAALRQQTFLVAAAGDTERFDALASQYMRRFPSSIYAKSFREQYAAEMARERFSTERMTRLEAALGGMDAPNRRQFSLSIAREGVLKGRFALAKFAAEKALGLIDEDNSDRARARLYEAAAVIVTEDAGQGLSSLDTVDRSKLDQYDAELLDAVAGIAREVARRPQELASADLESPPPPPTGGRRVRDAERMAATIKTTKTVRQALAKVDAMLGEVSK